MDDRPLLRFSRAALPALVAAALLSCVTAAPVLERPEGFALFRGETYRAITPEGVVLGVRVVANDPPQDQAFWAEAIKVQLASNGYRLLAQEAFKAPIGEGNLYEWVAPVGGEDWVYMTALAVRGPDIVVVEAAGSFSYYREHRPALLRSLASLSLPERK